MPSYCDTSPEVNDVPAQSDMVMFKPYFKIATSATSFDVHIKVPSECYFVQSDAGTFPSGGPCGSSSDLHCTISIDQEPDCSNTTEKVLIHTLNYSEDPSGHKINIYTENLSQGASIDGNSLSVKNVKS